MGDPGSSFIATKLASMIGGLFGGAAILTFIKPQTVGEAFMRGGVSVGSATLLSTPILKILDLPIDWDYQILAGFVCGFVAYSVLGMIANFLIQHKDSTIVEVAHELKGKKDAKGSNSNRR